MRRGSDESGSAQRQTDGVDLQNFARWPARSTRGSAHELAWDGIAAAEMYKTDGWAVRAQGMVEIQFNGVIDRKGLVEAHVGAAGRGGSSASRGQGTGERGAHMRDVSWGMDSRGEWGVDGQRAGLGQPGTCEVRPGRELQACRRRRGCFTIDRAGRKRAKISQRGRSRQHTGQARNTGACG